MIHNFNTRRNNWPKQSLAKVCFQQCFQPWSEAKQIEKYPPQGYCDIFRITCLRKEVDIQLNVSEKPRQSYLRPTHNCLSATAHGDGSLAVASLQTSLTVALIACMKTSLEVKWRYDGFPNLQYWQNHGFAKGMKPRSRTTQWHLLLQKNCYSAASLMNKVNLINPLLCLLIFVVHKGRLTRCEWESRNNVGIEKSGPPFLCLNCRSGSEKRPESRSVLQIQTHRRWAGSVLTPVSWKHLRLSRKVYLQQTDIIQRTLSQVVRETTALKKTVTVSQHDKHMHRLILATNQ